MGQLLYNKLLKGQNWKNRKINIYKVIPILTLLLIKSSFSFPICYSVKYIFVEVGKVCIEYKIIDKEIQSYATAETTGIVKIFRDIKYRGNSISSTDYKPKKFYFFQKEKNLKIIHKYIFKEKKILYEKLKNNKKESKIIELPDKSLKFFDIFTAGLFLFRGGITKNKEKSIKVFFNGKLQNVYYKVYKIGKEKIIEIKPEIEVEGLIRPKGIWKVYIKGENKYPYKMKISIKIGDLEIEKIKK